MLAHSVKKRETEGGSEHPEDKALDDNLLSW
jgi:hypothetical protein